MKNFTTYSSQSLTSIIKPFTVREKRTTNTLYISKVLHYKPSEICAYILLEDDLFILRLNDYICKIAGEDLEYVLNDVITTLNLTGKRAAEEVQIILWTTDCNILLNYLHEISNRFPQNPEEKALTFCYKNFIICSTSKLFEQTLENVCKEVNEGKHAFMESFTKWMMNHFIQYNPSTNKKGNHGYLPVTVTQMFQSILERVAYDNEIKTQEEAECYSTTLQKLHNRIMVYSNTEDFCEQDEIGEPIGPLGLAKKIGSGRLYNDYNYLPKPPFIRNNIQHINEVLHNVCHYDATLAYGSSVLFEKFPSNGWLKSLKPKKHMKIIDSHNSPRELDFCYKIVCTINNLQCINYPWLKPKYITGTGIELCDQGIIKADTCNIELTDVQYYSLKKTYTWDSITVHNLYTSFKDYLPNYIRETVSLLAFLRYDDKTNKVAKYFSKKCGERVYGKGVAMPRYADNRVVNGKFHTDDEIVGYAWRKYLIRPEWSIYMQDYARLNLITLATQINPNDLYYCDTDCLVFDYKQEYIDIVENYNNNIKKKYEGLNLADCIINAQIGQYKNEAYKISNGESNYYQDFTYNSTKRYAASYKTKEGIKEYAKACGIIKGTIGNIAEQQNISIVNNFESLLRHCDRLYK